MLDNDLVLLLCMLDRGVYHWYKPITAKDIACRFYRYLTDNEDIRSISFGDRGKEKLIDTYHENQIASLIKTNPMKYWGGNLDYGHAKLDGNFFWIDIKIKPKNYEEVYYMTKKLCIARIEKEINCKFDIRINLEDEYQYIVKELGDKYISDTQRETIIKARLGQGKFRNRLIEHFNTCLICGIQHKELLIASHIKPWRDSTDSEKLDVENGFILCANHDRLFDKGLLTVENNGHVVTSKCIETDLSKLNMSDRILYTLSSENKRYLDWHRGKVFESFGF